MPDRTFDDKTRYLQIAFNYDVGLVMRILPSIVKSERILIEAGMPFIKREGLTAFARSAACEEASASILRLHFVPLRTLAAITNTPKGDYPALKSVKRDCPSRASGAP